jgi:hypothetical protein
MFVTRLKTVITKWDIVIVSVAFSPIIAVLLYTFAESQQCWVQYLERFTKAGPILSSSAVAFMFWQWYRNSLKERIRYSHKYINKPLYKALFGTVRKSESNSIVVRDYSIRHKIDSSLCITGDYNVDKLQKSEEWERCLRWIRVQDKNLRRIRKALNTLPFYSNLYPDSLLKNLKELLDKLEEYDHSCHLLNFQIFQSLRKYEVPENWLKSTFRYIRGQLELEPETGLEKYVDVCKRVISELKIFSDDYKKKRDQISSFLSKLKSKFDNYLISLGLSIPEASDEYVTIEET